MGHKRAQLPCVELCRCTTWNINTRQQYNKKTQNQRSANKLVIKPYWKVYEKCTVEQNNVATHRFS